MLRPAVLLSFAACGAALLSSRPAAAYCRSTTCKDSCPRDEGGCKTTGAKLFWPSLCVGFSFQRDGTANLPMADVRRVIEDAFATWTDVPCGDATASIAFSELPDVTCREADYDDSQPNANVILFQDTKWTYKGVENNLAKTTVSFDTETGEIFDADIEVNYAYNEFTVSDDNVVYDLQSVITHEIGHFIGLDHSPDRDATMYAGYDEGTIELRTLEADDLAAICGAYPPGREGTCDPKPKNGLGDLCSEDPAAGCACAAGRGAGSTGAPGLAIVALGLLSFRGRRSRRGAEG